MADVYDLSAPSLVMPEAPILLQFTDRSRHMTRIGRCPRAGFLSTAFGPTGYGIQRKAQSVPLASGTMLHEAHEAILRWVQAHDALPPDDVVREGIATAHAKYDETFVARGLQFWEAGDEALQRTVAEQKALIEALVWVWAWHSLPTFHAQYRIVSIESEEVTVYACTCGLGDGVPPWDAHVARGCSGIAIQTKADWIGEHREYAEQFTYHELKTTGAYPDAFASKWFTDIQPYLGAHGWEQRTGHKIAQTYIHGFLKGRRTRERAPGDVGRKYTGPEYQDSRLVYAFCRPADFPVYPEADWQMEWEWQDEEGKTRRLGPKYKKTLTTFYPGGVEAWVRALSPEQARKHLTVVGPLLPQEEVVAGTIAGWVATEQRTQLALWDIADALADGRPWYDPKVLALIDHHFPQSWQCDRFGANHRCEFVPVCKRESGWQDPLSFMSFIPRRPHHEPELLQMRQRGLEPPEDQGEEGEE